MSAFSKADQLLKSFVPHPRGDMVTVCAWCFPKDKIFEAFPNLRDKVAISHGICKEHRDDMKRQITPLRK